MKTATYADPSSYLFAQVLECVENQSMKFPEPFSKDYDLIFFLMECFKTDLDQRATINQLFNHDWITEDLSIFDESQEQP